MKHLVAAFVLVCLACIPVVSHAQAPATQPSHSITTRDLSGKWQGEKDGVKVEVTFHAPDKCTWRIQYDPASNRSAVILADLKRINDEKSNSIGLRLDFVTAATGEKHSQIIGKLESTDSSKLNLTILPAARQSDNDYPAQTTVSLTKIIK